MVAQAKRIFIGIGVLFLAVLACQPGPPPPPTAGNNDIALTLTSVIQTLSALTISAPAGATLSTEAIPSATNISPAETTALPILTPTLTVIPSPSVPLVSVTTGTNCRSGPGQVYDIIGGAPVGIKFVVIGKSTPTNYWIIRLQDGRECWLWGQYAVLEGNLSTLPEYAIPATPLPPIGSITGVIKNFGGELIANARVTALYAERTVMTNSQGRYTIDNLAVGNEYIGADAPDYRTDFHSVSVNKGSTATADFVLAGLIIPSGDPTIIEGRVLVNGSPAAGVDVWLWSFAGPTITDSAGHYRLGAVLLTDRVLVLAKLGNMRGGVEVSLLQQPMTIPDINLIPR